MYGYVEPGRPVVVWPCRVMHGHVDLCRIIYSHVDLCKVMYSESVPKYPYIAIGLSETTI